MPLGCLCDFTDDPAVGFYKYDYLCILPQWGLYCHHEPFFYLYSTDYARESSLKDVLPDLSPRGCCWSCRASEGWLPPPPRSRGRARRHSRGGLGLLAGSSRKRTNTGLSGRWELFLARCTLKVAIVEATKE